MSIEDSKRKDLSYMSIYEKSIQDKIIDKQEAEDALKTFLANGGKIEQVKPGDYPPQVKPQFAWGRPKKKPDLPKE